MKWHHSVVIKDDFLTEWGASWNAFQDQPLDATLCHGHFAEATSSPTHCTRHKNSSRASRSVHFGEHVQVVIEETANSQLDFTLTHSELSSWLNKPWSLETPVPEDVSCPLSQVVFNANTTMHPQHENDRRGTHPGPSAHRREKQAIRALEQVRGWTPAWAQDLWDTIFVPQSRIWNPRQGPTVELKTWLVNDHALQTCMGHRRLDLDENWDDWYFQFRKLWIDQLDPLVDFEVYIVHPEPPRASGTVEMHVAHVILSQIQSDRQAIMLTAYADFGESHTHRLWRAALAATPMLSADDIFDFIPDGFKRNTLIGEYTFFHDETLFDEHRIPVHHGAGIVAYIDRRSLFAAPATTSIQGVPVGITLPDLRQLRPPDTPDFHSLLAMGPPRLIGPGNPDDILQDPDIATDLDPDQLNVDHNDLSDVEEEAETAPEDEDSPWHSSIIYSLSVPASTGRTDWTSHDTLHRTVADNMAISHHDLQAVYHVRPNPIDLGEHYTQTFVALLHWDIKPGENKRLVLLDVEFYRHGPIHQPEVVREARLLPFQITRSQLFHHLGIRKYCDQTRPQGCLLWHNGKLQLSQFEGLHIIENGDHLRIALPPSEELVDDIPTRVAAAACHRGNSISDVSIWHAVGGLDTDDETLLPLREPGNDDTFHLMQRSVSSTEPQYEFDPTKPWRNQIHTQWQTRQINNPQVTKTPRIATYFLDHSSSFRSDVSRVVDLPPNFNDWESAIRSSWEDCLVSERYRLDCACPEPSTTSLTFSGYVIVTQNPDPTKASILMAVYDARTDAWTEKIFALVVPRLTMKRHLFEIGNLHSTCRPHGPHECTLQYADHVYHESEIIPIDHGMCLSVEVHHTCEQRPDIARPEHVHVHALDRHVYDLDDDNVELLQESLRRTFASLGTALASRAYDNWLCTCTLEDDIPIAQHRIPEDPAEKIRAIAQENEALNERIRRETFWLMRVQVPPAITQVFDYLHAVTADDPIWAGQPTIMTWYLNSHTAWRFNLPRPVELPEDVTQWIQAVQRSWLDEWDHTVDGLFFLVNPPVYDLENGIQAHVIVIQHLQPTFAGLLVSVYDNAVADNRAQRFAILHEGPITHEQVLDYSDHDVVCSVHGTVCHSWCGWDQLNPHLQYALPSGSGVSLSVARQNVAPFDAHAWDDFTLDQEDQVNLLQIRSTLSKPEATPLRLEELLDFAPNTMVVVQLIPGVDMPLLPALVEVPEAWNEASLQNELQCWGHSCQVFSLGQHDKALCFPFGFAFSDACHHFVYFDFDVTNPDGIFLHSSKDSLDLKGHMKFLHSRGYPKAVVQSIDPSPVGFTKVGFLISLGTVESKDVKHKCMSAWPPQQPSVPPLPLNREPLATPILASPDCLLRSPVTYDEVCAFLRSADNVLCQSFEGLDLPQVCLDAFQWCGIGLSPHIDRLIIYTDGSSIGGSKFDIPDCPGDPNPKIDTWAFLVVGETYAPQPGQPKFHLVGWTAQQVLYDPASSQHLFADRLGSDVAEREALFFAGLWRLGFDSNLPTVFRPDSLSTCKLASGQCGTANPGPAYRALRGIFQALAARLPGDSFQFAHVTSHVNEPFNEFVDCAAKTERTKSFYHPRQPIDFHKWLPVVPYLWMFLDTQAGLPPLHLHGFLADAPDLPSSQPHGFQADAVSPTLDFPLQWDCSLILATANVGSLCLGPDGHGGKLDYLRQQFLAHQIHFCGIQESRTQACSSNVHGVYRLSSGCLGGHHGVELWVNTKLPLATCGDEKIFFSPDNFTVVHSDHRSLLVRVENPIFKAWVLVAHAPQSGRSVSERETWWLDLADILQAHCTTDPLFVLIDANASAGGSDGLHVFSHDAISSSTRFLRDFLDQFDLCLPSTSNIHRGSQITWRSPDGMLEKRIDFVVVPRNWFDLCQDSVVLQQFDLGHIYDHQAVQLTLNWMSQHDRPKPCETLPNYDRSSIAQSEVSKALRDIAVSPWQSDIESHVHRQNEALHNVLAQHCRPAKQGPKKPYLTEQIWLLRKQKLHAKKKLHELGSRLRSELLHVCFAAWQSSRTPAIRAEDEGVSSFVVSLFCHRLWWSASLFVHSHQLKISLKQARLQAIEKDLEALPSHVASSAVLQVVKKHQGTTNLSKLKPRALPQVQAADGSICSTGKASLDRWIEYFMLMEGGSRIDTVEQRNTWRDHLGDLQELSFDEQLLAMPSLTDLELALRRVSKNKATGPDGIPGEVCRLHPACLARQLYAQLLKLALHGQEDLIHKGGFLSFLYKGKGHHQHCESYRSILVSSHLGKCLHRTLRTHQQSLYEAFLQRQQVGGRRRVPVSLGLHIVRGFLRIQHLRNRSAGICFLDLKEAFYRIIRPLAVNVTMTDEAIATMLHRLGLPRDALEDLRELLSQPNAIQQAELPWFAQKYVSALHQDTHFSLHGQPDRCRTTIGSRPGDSFADVVFGYTFARVLQSLEHQLHERDLLDVCGIHAGFQPFAIAPPTEHVPLLGAVWMDDLAVCVSASSASALESKIGQATSCLLDLCKKFGMTPNLAKGKTEILLALRGPGSRALKLKYHGASHGQSMPIIGEHEVHTIAVVQEYTHLGNSVHMNGTGRTELRRRIAIGQTAFNSQRKLLLQSRYLALPIRLQIFESLVLSKVMYGSEVWFLYDKASLKYFQGAIMRLYRRLLKAPHDAHMSDDAILHALNVPAPEVLLRRQRLRYVATLVKCSDTAPWGLIYDDIDWMAQLKDDLRWMYAQLERSSPLTDPDIDFQRWLTILASHPTYWKKLVNRAVRHSVLQRSNIHHVTEFHRNVYKALASQGGTMDLPVARQSSTQSRFGCMTCGLRCRNKAGEGAHMFRAHHQVAEVRHFFDETHCPFCMKEFHTFTRIKMHLRSSANCLEGLRNRRLSCPIAPGSGSGQDTQLARSQQGSLPVQVAFGPLPDSAPLRRHISADWTLWTWFTDQLIEHSALALEDLLDHLRALPADLVISWTNFCRTMELFHNEYSDEDVDVCGLSRDDLKHLIQALTSPSTWPWLEETSSTEETPVNSLNLEDLQKWCTDLSAYASPWYDHVIAPRPFGRVRVLLHAFSGRRRPGDFQDFLDQAMVNRENFLVLTISLDLIIDRRWGDISIPETRQYWVDAAREGLLLGILCGPPCNTWSRARGRDLTSPEDTAKVTSGPRVVRSASELWGFSCLAIREIEAVATGNLLLLFSLEIMLWLYCTGGFGILEHPSEPDDPSLAAIWRLPIIKMFLAFPEFQQLRVMQGLFGAKSAKPTDLLLLRLPRAVSTFHEWRTCVNPPSGGSIGRDGTIFNTSSLKEYPPAFCGAIANVFLRALDSMDVHLETEMPSEFLNTVKKLHCTEFSAVIGRDFAG